MKKVWTRRTIGALPQDVWRTLTDLRDWPAWGPSVRSAEIDGTELGLGVTGTIKTIGGVQLPFEITSFEPGHRWEWRVAGLPATDHVVADLGNGSCDVSFGVPLIAAPYLTVCRVALRRIETLTSQRTGVAT